MNPSPYPTPFSSAHGRAVIVKILLIVGAIATGLLFVGQAFTYAFPLAEEEELGDNPIAAAIVLVVALLAVFNIIIYIATVVFFCIWLYRAYDNLRTLNPSRRLDLSPGWAVGSFFIPFANLVVPYRAVKEVWQKSGPPDEALLAEPSTPAWFPIWWTFWLLSNFVDRLASRRFFLENVSESTATLVSMISLALSIAAGLIAYLIVDLIDQRQEESSTRLGLGKFSGPPPPPPDLSMPEVVASAPGPNISQQS